MQEYILIKNVKLVCIAHLLYVRHYAWHCAHNTVVKGFLAFLIFLLVLSINHTIEVYTIDGSTKIFWAYSLRIIIYIYTKFLLPVMEALPKKKALEDHNRAKTACFLSLRLGQRRWTMITAKVMSFGCTKSKSRMKIRNHVVRADWWVFKTYLYPLLAIRS